MESSTFKVYVNPLINWTWIGGVLLAAGSIIAAWPDGGLSAQRSYSLKPGAIRSGSTAGN
jgi:cytochrome c-type biogenesis protein CcmF